MLTRELHYNSRCGRFTCSLTFETDSQSEYMMATSDMVNAARQQVLDYLNASPKEYKCIFTAGATAALKLVGECFPWSRESNYMYTVENHNSVLGIREYALDQGATAVAIDVEDVEYGGGQCVTNGLSIQIQKKSILRRSKTSSLDTDINPSGNHYNLFAFPSECNFSGAKFPLDMVKIIKEDGGNFFEGSPHLRGRWLVLIDAAKGCSTEPPDLARYPADFVVFSFYKITNVRVKWSGVRTQHLTTPFVVEMYDRLRETLNEYEVIICRWPEYTFVLENAIADVEKATIEALERQYADVLSPLKDSMGPKKFGLKYVQKLAKRNSLYPYVVPEELGILLNTMKRLLDVLRPKIEAQFKTWGYYMPDGGNAVPGEHLGEVTVTLRAKFRNYLQAVVEKLAENTRAQSATKLKKIIQDSKDVVVESDIRNRMQPLKDQLIQAINHLHTIFEVHVFVAICRGFWDRMGQDVLNFLENRKENRSWYKGSRVTLAVLDDTFASQMQQLLGNSLQERDLDPPNSIKEARSVLCKDAPNHKDSNFYY